MKFTKMHGAGNDYVYINCFDEQVGSPERLAVSVSDRHKGVGSDGLVLIMPSDVCDFRMRMFNADGSEAQMCGNASRCVGKYVYENGLTGKTELTLETLSGVKRLSLYPEGGKVKKVCVDMGEPVLEASAVPVALPVDRVVNCPVHFPSGARNITCVSMGNPHTVIFEENIDGCPEKYGTEIEHHVLFPERTNVEFVQCISPVHLRMRVWERGSGETQACGTGACATLVAAVLNGRAERKATVGLLGGDLQVEWRESDNHVYMTGDAVTVFTGQLTMDELEIKN
ncbi:MAG: diaminopimelate epimerase [Bacteroidales bacterium]|jgi:diaminopimelate epimerase|nr:diaminopimelate epimerase [Bacteroidales bacterium]